MKKKNHSIKLIHYLESLSLADRERFQAFVHSPYFNQHQKTTELLDYIIEHLSGQADQLSRERIFEALFPGEEYQDQQIYNLLSYLKKLYQKFLAHQNLEKSPLIEQRFTLEEAFRLNQFDLLDSRAKKLEKQLQKLGYRDSEYHLTHYRLQSLLGYYSGRYKDRSESTNFQQMLEHLDRFYILEKLQNSCHLTANMLLLNSNYNFSFLDELLTYLDAHRAEFADDIGIQMYQTILMSLREDDQTQHYREMKRLLNEEFSKLSPREATDLYNFSYNFCIWQINKGRKEYSKELFDLYQQALETKILLVNGLIGEWDYKNITTLGCNLGEFTWTEDFINEYREKLLPDKQENAYRYNLANLYYHKKMYQEALDILRYVTFTDFKYHLSAAFLQIRIHYELGNTELLLSQLDALRIYVMRNQKMTTDEKKGYNNFIRLAKKLALIRNQSDTIPRKQLQEKLQNLQEKVKKTDPVINRFWLLEETEPVTTAEQTVGW